MAEELAELFAGARQFSLSADEPRGVDRVGVRLTCIDKDNKAVQRRFLGLQALPPVKVDGQVLLV